jgi:hypothetical protein
VPLIADTAAAGGCADAAAFVACAAFDGCASMLTLQLHSNYFLAWVELLALAGTYSASNWCTGQEDGHKGSYAWAVPELQLQQ